jgi:hypothetical protein
MAAPSDERPHPLRTLIRKPALTRYLPQLLGVPAQHPILSAEDRQEFPELAPDFDVLAAELEDAFLQYDRDALAGQNRFRLVHLLLIVGGASATVLGALQCAAHGGQLWLGITEATVAGLLAPLAVAARSGRSHRAYFTNRLKAERLRSEYFVYLVGGAEYDGVDGEQRVEVLRKRIATIEDEAVGS